MVGCKLLRSKSFINVFKDKKTNMLKAFFSFKSFQAKTNLKELWKNSSIKTNEILKWTKALTKNIRLNVKEVKVINYSNKAAAVTELSRCRRTKSLRITGYSKPLSLKQYLQLDQEYHGALPLSIIIQKTVTKATQKSKY